MSANTAAFAPSFMPSSRIRTTRSRTDGVKVSSLEELRAFQRSKSEADAVGAPMAPLVLPIDPAMPDRVNAIMDAVDALLPQLMKDKHVTLADLFRDDPERVRGEAAPWHKTVLGANALAVAAVAVEIGKQVSGVGDVLTIAAVAHAAWKAAGAASYAAHHALDNYDCFGTDSFEFQVHHDVPQDLAQWEAALTTYNVGTKALPLLVATAALGPTLPVATAALVFLGGAMLAPTAHQWQHQAGRPEVVKLLQKIGVLASGHGAHHGGNHKGLMEGEEALAHVGAYDILTGHLGGSVNALFDGAALPRRVEALVYKLTGTEPNSWKDHPELKEIWLASTADRPAVARRTRIEKQEKNIASHEEKLAWARSVASAADATDAQRKVAAAIVERFPAKLVRMKDQLAAFQDPSLLQPLFDANARAERRLHELLSPVGTRCKALNPESHALQVRDAEAALAAARAALLDAAPFLG